MLIILLPDRNLELRVLELLKKYGIDQEVMFGSNPLEIRDLYVKYRPDAYFMDITGEESRFCRLFQKCLEPPPELIKEIHDLLSVREGKSRTGERKSISTGKKAIGPTFKPFPRSVEKIKVMILCAGPSIIPAHDRNPAIAARLARFFVGLPPEYLIVMRQKLCIMRALKEIGENREPIVTVVDPAYLVSSGEMISEPFGTKKFEPFLEGRKDSYDYIISDTCPLFRRGLGDLFIPQVEYLLKPGGAFFALGGCGDFRTSDVKVGRVLLSDLIEEDPELYKRFVLDNELLIKL